MIFLLVHITNYGKCEDIENSFKTIGVKKELDEHGCHCIQKGKFNEFFGMIFYHNFSDESYCAKHGIEWVTWFGGRKCPSDVSDGQCIEGMKCTKRIK